MSSNDHKNLFSDILKKCEALLRKLNDFYLKEYYIWHYFKHEKEKTEEKHE